MLIANLIRTLYNTRMLTEENGEKKFFFKSKEQEHHLTFIGEMNTESKYLTQLFLTLVQLVLFWQRMLRLF